jgi:large subunit ribosomal protein L14
MILQKTLLTVSDNSGARVAECIKVSKRCSKFITVVVKKAAARGKVNKGDIFSGIIVRSKRLDPNAYGFTSNFGDNSVVLSKKNGEPIGTRIFGPVDKNLRNSGYMKIISIAKRLI